MWWRSKKIELGLLTLILLLGLFLRSYKVSSIPPGLTWDESSLGYNAFSILQTGKDEYGAFLPINLKSFGDYKPALYAYLDIPFIGLLGLSELAVRLPSIIAGVLFILLIYLFVKELFKNSSLALITAFFASITPLSVQFSRIAFETNVATVFNLAAVFAFVKAQKNSKWYLYSFILFSLSFLTYQGSRLIVPIFLIGLTFIYRKSIKFSSKSLILGFGLIGGIVAIVLVNVFLQGQSNRLQTTNFFAYTRSNETIDQISKEDGLLKNSLQFQLLHGEWFSYLSGLIERYTIYFSPKMLFVQGDYDPRHRVPEMGVLPYYSLILFILGIYFLAIKKSKEVGLIAFYLAIAPLPAVLSRDLINMVRALNLQVPLTILEGAGAYFLIQILSKKTFGKIILIGLIGIFIYIYGMYLDNYFVHMPKEYSQGFLYGYEDSLLLAGAQDKQSWNNYDHVVITDFYGEPYIYYLFYTSYSPQKYQSQAKLEQKSLDVGTVRQIDNIQFRHISWPTERGDKNTLFIGTKEELPDQDVLPFKEYTLIGDINFLDKTSAFRVVKIAK